MKGSRNETKSYALKLLGYRSRSRKEMIDKLQRKGFDHESIHDVMEFLESAGFIDDKALVSELFTYSLEKKFLGGKAIRAFMAGRGIDKGLIDEALSTLDREREAESASACVKKKLRTMENYPRDVVRRRVWGMLQRRGFSVDVIRRTMKSFHL